MPASTDHGGEEQTDQEDQAAAVSSRCLDTLNGPPSHWLDSTLSDMYKKKEAMLSILQADGDSFVEKAEMYYKKIPELVGMLEDLCKSYRSLAEKYDTLRPASFRRSLSSSTRESCKSDRSSAENYDTLGPECIPRSLSSSTRDSSDDDSFGVHPWYSLECKLFLARAKNKENIQVISEHEDEINKLTDENKDLKSRLLKYEVKRNKTLLSRFGNAICFKL